MNSREQIMAVALIGLIFLVGAGGGGYFLVYEPIVQASANEETLDKEIAELDKQVESQRQATQRLGVARTRSLPADKKLAEREYAIALRQLMDTAGVPKDSQVNLKTVDNSPRAGVPEISKGKPIYTRIAYEIVIKKADMWMIKDFLQAYYQLGLLHQITALNIKKDEDGGAKNAGKRNDLTVTLTTEAIIVDGAEARKTLLPVPTAFAAVGGGGIYSALRVTPSVARAIHPEVKVPTLTPVNRDYSLIVRKDPFNGPLVDPVDPPKKSIKIATIRDVEIKSGDEKPSPVRFAVSGDGANTATVTAIAAGSLIPEGALPVDAKNYTIELPAVEASEGTSTITVVATTADGKSTDKTTFKVSVKPSEKPTPPLEDIAAYVVLIGTTPRSDGTAWARVKDNANRLRYEIEAKPKGVTVVKEWFVLEWKKDRDYEEAPGVLHITAEGTKTNRTFKVIAVDADGLIVSDLKPEGSAPAAPKGKGFGPKGPSAPKQGHASAMAALGGNRITAVSKPKLYRWDVGESLTKLREIPEEEAKQILKSAEANGPVFDVAAMPK